MGLLSLEMWGFKRSRFGGMVGCIMDALSVSTPCMVMLTDSEPLSLEHKRTPGCRQVCGYHWGMGRIGVLRVGQAFLREEAPGSSPGQQGRDGAAEGDLGGRQGSWVSSGSLRPSQEEGVPAGSNAAGKGRRTENEM